MTDPLISKILANIKSFMTVFRIIELGFYNPKE